MGWDNLINSQFIHHVYSHSCFAPLFHMRSCLFPIDANPFQSGHHLFTLICYFCLPVRGTVCQVSHIRTLTLFNYMFNLEIHMIHNMLNKNNTLGVKVQGCQVKKVSPIFILGQHLCWKFLSYHENFCPPGQAMSGCVFLAFSVLLAFSMLYNLFHHTPRMIFDPFW